MKKNLQKQGQKLLCVLLAMLLMIGMLPVQDLRAAEQPADGSQTVSEDENLSSFGAGAAHEELSQEEQQAMIDECVENAAHASQDNGKVLLIEDNLPWKSTANHSILSSVTSYKKVTTKQFLETDLSQYTVIMFANDQAFSTYENYAKFKEYLEAFVSLGGVLIFGACDSGWANGKLVEELPGGVTKGNNLLYRNTIADRTHPIVTGRYSNGVSLVDADLYNNYCSHVYFNENSLPQGSDVIIRGTDGKPTLVEYPWGKGKVIASGLTWEHNYIYGKKNGYGTYAQKAMDDVVLYALSSSDVDSKDLRSLSVYRSYEDETLIYVGDRSTQDKLYQAKVTIGTETQETDSLGMAHFSIADGEYAVTASMEGYETQKRILNLKHGSVEPFYLQKGSSKGNPYLTMASAVYGGDKKKDLLMERLNYDQGDETDCTVTVDGDWGGHPAGDYVFYQGAKQERSSKNSFTFKPGKTFSADAPIYCMMISSDGTKSKGYQTGITIRETNSGFIGTDENVKENFTIGQKTGFTIPGDMPIIGGTKFEISMDSIPVAIVTEDNKVRIAFGGTDVKSIKDNWESLTKKMDKAAETADRINKCSELMETFGGKTGSFSLGGSFDKPKLKVSGYAEGVWDKKGKITNLTGRILVGTSVKYTYNHQFVVGPVPVYFEIGGGASLELDAKVTKVLTDTGQIEVSLPITFTPNFSIGGGAGINGALSVGAEGKVELPVLMDIPNKHVKVSLTGSMALKASLLFVFKAEKNIAKGTWIIYDKYHTNMDRAGNINLGEGTDSGLSEQMALHLGDASSYELEDRSYLSKTSSWGSASEPRASQSELYTYDEILQDYVLPGTQPSLERAGDQTVLVFQSDNGSGGLSYTQLMYSYWNGAGFTEPQPVWESADGGSDYQASLKTSGASLYLVWQRRKASADTDATDDMGTGINDGTIAKIAADMEIAAAVWDPASRSFGNQRYLTDNTVYDGMPQLAVGGGKAEAVWVQNDANDLLGKRGNNKIYRAALLPEDRAGSTKDEIEEEIGEETVDEALAPDETLVFSDEVLTSDEALASDETLTPDETAEHPNTDGEKTSEPVSANGAEISEQIGLEEPENLDEAELTEQTSVSGSNAEPLQEEIENEPQAQATADLLFETEEYVSSLDAGYDENGILLAAYDLDMDHDLDTTEDTETYLWREGGFSRRLTQDDTADLNAQISGGKVFWYKQGQILCYDPATEMTAPLWEDGIPAGSAFQILEENGSQSVVWGNADENGNDCIIIRRLGESAASVLASPEGSLQFFDTVLLENGDYLTVYSSRPEQDRYTLGAQILRPQPDLEIVEVNAADVDRKDGLQPFSITVKNNGMTTASAADLSFYKGNDLIATTDLGSSIAPGEKKTLIKEIQIGVPNGETTYSVVLSDGQNANVGKNRGEITLGRKDIAIEAKEYHVQNKLMLFIKMRNLTDQATAAQISIHENSVDGTLLETKQVEELAPNEEYTFLYKIHRGQMDVALGEDKYYYVNAFSEGETSLTDNDAVIVIPTSESEVTDVSMGQAAQIVVDVKNKKATTIQLKADVSPKTAINKTVVWESSDQSVASVSDRGVVHVKKAGSAEISVTTEVNGCRDSVRIYAVDPARTAPTALKIVSASDSVRLSWKKAKDIVNYEVLRADSKNGKYEAVGRTNFGAYSDYTAQIGKTYYYKVRGYTNYYGTLIYGNATAALLGKAQLGTTKLQKSTVTHKQVSMRLTSVDGADGYIIYRSLKKNGAYKKIGTTASTSYTDTKVKLGTVYYYKAVAYKKISGKTYTGSLSGILALKPEVASPSYMNLYAVDHKSVTIYTSLPSDVQGCEIYRSTKEKSGYKKIASVKTGYHLDSGLVLGKTYYYKGRAYVIQSGKRHYSSYTTLYTYTPSLAAPQNVKADPDGTKRIRISWEKTVGAVGYEILRADSYYSTYQTLASVKGLSYVDTKAGENTYRYYKVRPYYVANKKKVYGAESYTRSARAYFAPPVVQDLTYPSYTSLKLTWRQMSEGKMTELSYSDSYYGEYKVLTNTDKGSYIHKNLTQGCTYYYRLRTYRLVNKEKVYTDYSRISGQVRLPAASKVRAASAGIKEINLSWAKTSGATIYYIYRSQNQNGSYSKIGETPKTSYKDAGLLTGAQYFYKIMPYRIQDGVYTAGDFSDPFMGVPGLASPTSVKCKAPASKKLKLTWKKNGQAAGYEIFRSTKKDSGYKKVTVTKNTSYINSKLAKNKTYYYKIRSYTTIDEEKIYSSWSKPVKGKTSKK